MLPLKIICKNTRVEGATFGPFRSISARWRPLRAHRWRRYLGPKNKSGYYFTPTKYYSSYLISEARNMDMMRTEIVFMCYGSHKW